MTCHCINLTIVHFRNNVFCPSICIHIFAFDRPEIMIKVNVFQVVSYKNRCIKPNCVIFCKKTYSDVINVMLQPHSFAFHRFFDKVRNVDVLLDRIMVKKNDIEIIAAFFQGQVVDEVAGLVEIDVFFLSRPRISPSLPSARIL